LLVTPGGPTEDKPNTHFAPSANVDSVSHSYTIRVKDCIKSYEILLERGAEFITSPLDRGAEIRCFFRDPDGHLFEISEYRA
jgi:catechol 2,3-dioxygenase-like lactoylglutathione lyase family enzyme